MKFPGNCGDLESVFLAWCEAVVSNTSKDQWSHDLDAVISSPFPCDSFPA